MKIIKFENFSINEARTSTIGREVKKLAPKVYLSILDVVIDDNGKLYNGDGNTLVKGRVQRTNGKISKILGTDGKEYPAGIEKSGRLVATKEREDEAGNIIALSSNEQPLRVSKELIKNYKLKGLNGYWYIFTNNNYYDYYNLIPIIGTGWVNMKIDMEIVKRVRRYSADMGVHSTREHVKFLSKLSDFALISDLKRKKTDKQAGILRRRTIQKEMSTIILLHCINEIKDFFNPSSSGFLFESFLAGLIPNARINDDNTAADLVADGNTYQIKLISGNTPYVDVVLDKTIGSNAEGSNKVILEERYLSYYIISVKFIDRIEIYVIDATTTTTENNGPMEELITKTGSFVMSKVKDMADIEDSIVNRYIINLTNIEGRIENLGSGLKENLEKLYLEISDFQYNVETIISGIDKDGKRIGDIGFDMYDLKCKKNVDDLKIFLGSLIGDFKRDIRP